MHLYKEKVAVQINFRAHIYGTAEELNEAKEE
jgi:hypothetical protein